MAINKPQVKKVVEKVGGAYGRDSTLIWFWSRP